MQGYISPRAAIGDRTTWPQHFKNAGYYTARVSKIYHMGVPGGIEAGSDGADDPASWTERFNSPGPEWQAPGTGDLPKQAQMVVVEVGFVHEHLIRNYLTIDLKHRNSQSHIQKHFQHVCSPNELDLE